MNNTPVGIVPDAFDWEGLAVTPEAKKALFHIDRKEWLEEVGELEQYFTLFGEKFPEELRGELERLKERVLSSG